jgi:pyochelin synthetase
MTLRFLYSDFINAVLRFPKNTAIVEGNVSVNYHSLADISLILSDTLAGKINRSEPVIAVCIDKSWQQVIAVLGILFSKSVYLPIDMAFPFERIKTILLASGSKTIITQQKYQQLFRLLDESYHVIYIENITDQENKYSLNQINSMFEIINTSQHPSDLAYIIYTSGSTGDPKGVAVSHYSVVNTLQDINNRFNISQHDSILALSQLSFDLSVYDIFGLLSVGAKIVIPTEMEQFEPAEWLKLIQRENITLWNSVPAYAQMLDEYCLGKLPSCMRLFLLSGDWISIDLVKKLKSKINQRSKIISLGGATEVSIWSIFYEIKDINPRWKSIPYGYAMENQTVEILDQNLNHCQEYQSGEIYIGGLGLAKEYYKDEEKTKASFIFHPLTNKRLYKTGDYGRYISDSGLIEFLGRKDSQIKLNGYRVELTEIEHHLSHYSGIKKVCVLEHRKQLFAFCEIGDLQISIESYKNTFSSKLPSYMIPIKYFFLKSFPLTLNGKINKVELKEKYLLNHSKIESMSSAHHFVQKMWTEILAYSPVALSDDFFDVGGDSIRAVTLIGKINKHYHCELPLSVLYQTRTLSNLKNYIETYQNKPSVNYSVINLSHHQRQPIFLFHPVSGQIFCYHDLSKLLENKFDVYAIESFSTQHTISIVSMAAEYVKAIQQIQPEGPYYFAGWSIGGLLAYETAHQLREKSIKFLGLFDTYPPINALLNSSLQFSRHKLIKSILQYYLQEINKIVQINDQGFINLDELCKQEPMRSIDFVFNYMVSKTVPNQIVTNFLKDFTSQFKNILNAMINYKPNHEKINDIVFIRANNTPLELVSLWQSYVVNPIKFEQVEADHIHLLDKNNINQLYSVLSRYF